MVGLPKRLAVLPFGNVFTGSNHQGYREQLQGDSELKSRWRVALLHILHRHHRTVFKPEILDRPEVEGIQQPPDVRRATQRAFSDNNIVLAYSMDADCPWVVTNDASDMIDYTVFTIYIKICSSP